MKILAYGKNVYMRVDRMFTCKQCGCIFVAGYDEYEPKAVYANEVVYEARCPCCRRMTYVDENSIYVSTED